MKPIERLAYFIFLAFVTVLIGLAVAFCGVYPYSPDSADYFEQAYGLTETGKAWSVGGLQGPLEGPSPLFPIGLPIVLWAFHFLNLPPKDAALLISASCALILPWTLHFFLRKALVPWQIAVVVLVSCTSAGFLSAAQKGLTDAPTTFVAVLCAGLLLKKGGVVSVIGAGLVGGAAYALRNASIALLVAAYAVFVLEFLSDPPARRVILERAGFFTFGALIVLVPLATRNLSFFGQINPYMMRPSSLGAVVNTRTFLSAFVEDFSGSHWLAEHVAWSVGGLALLVGSLAWGGLKIWATWQTTGTAMKRWIWFSTAYAALGATGVIAARTKYQWGETINDRHTFQYLPFVTVLVVGLAQRAVNLKASSSSLIIMGLTLLGIVRFGFFLETQYDRADRRLPFEAFRAGQRAFCDAPPGSNLFSNYSFVFRIECRAKVRPFDLVPTPLSGEDNPGFTSGVGNIMIGTILRLPPTLTTQNALLGIFPGRGGVDKGDS